MMVLLVLVVAALSWTGTGAVRRYALSHSLLDHPNARSSHTAPTPRGGGAAIAAAFLMGLVGSYFLGGLSGAQLSGYVGAGTLVALIGFLDDQGHVAARWRLLGHFIAAGWLLYWLGGLPPLVMGNAIWEPGIWGWPLGIIGLVWLLNLYNFMDGIDGLAGGQAVTVCAVASLVYLVTGHASLIFGPLCMAAAAGGFLVWNWPPARIFMGDVGSGFIGLMIGGMALQGGHVAPDYLWVWAILMGVFIVDATWTLLSRLVQGKRLYEAHRTHAYQHASQAWKSHGRVLWCVVGLNLIWLPLSLYIGFNYMNVAGALILSYLPLLILTGWLNAGRDR